MAQSIQNQLQDTIEFSVRAEKIIVNNTVKMTVRISATMVDDLTHESLPGEVKAALGRFIVTDEWQISNMVREASESGVEQVSMIATVRVSEKENYDLDKRCEIASRKALKLRNPYADTAVPYVMIDNTEKELRLTILANVTAEREKIVEASGRAYRIGRLTFSSLNHNFSNNTRAGAAVYASMAVKSSQGSGFGTEASDAELLGNASKLEITATVVLSVNAGA